MARSGGTWNKGETAKRSPKMPSEREALRLIKEMAPKAVRKLGRLMECGEKKVELAAAKAIVDKVIRPEAMANPWQVPDELLEKSPQEQLAWALRQKAMLGDICAQLESAASASDAVH